MEELERIDPSLPTYVETYEVMSDIARMHIQEAAGQAALDKEIEWQENRSQGLEKQRRLD